MSFPMDICVNDNHEISILDNRRHSVHVYDYKGNNLCSMCGNGSISFAISVSINTVGKLIVTGYHQYDILHSDEELKLFSKLYIIIVQIYNFLHRVLLENNILWKRLENAITKNKNHHLKNIYCKLEYAKCITMRSLWKNNDEYRIFADTVVLMYTSFKPLLLNAAKKKYFYFKKRNIKNIKIPSQKKTVLGYKIDISKNTAHLWWQLLLIKCSMTSITTKEHFSDVHPDWAYHLAQKICDNNHAATVLYKRVRNIVTTLLAVYFKHRNKSSTKLHFKIVSILKKNRIISGNIREKDVSNLIEVVVMRYIDFIKNLDKIDAWEYEDFDIFKPENLISALSKSLHRSKTDINLPGLHDRTPLMYVLSLHDYNQMANMFDQKYIRDLVKVLLQSGADPDKFSALTLHPLHYASLVSPSFKKWFQEKCVLKNPCDGLLGINPEVFFNHYEFFFNDFINDKDNEIEREKLIEDSFYNAIAVADKIHYSFPNYVIDLDYFLNLYNQNGQTPLICATDAKYFHINWKNNLDTIIFSGANVDDKEIISFDNGKAVYGENALTKILKFKTNENSLGICLSAPQHVLNIKKAIFEYLVANGSDKNIVKHFAANSLFLASQSKRAMQEQSVISNEQLENMDKIIEFWFEVTVLLHDMQLVEAYQNFYYNFDNWINELVFGANVNNKMEGNAKNEKPNRLQSPRSSRFLRYTNDKIEDIATPKEENKKGDSKNYLLEKHIPSTRFILFPNKNLNVVAFEDDELFWEYSAVSPDYYKCKRCEKQNVEVTAFLKTSPIGEKYIETNEIQHVCEIQNFADLEKIFKRSDYEIGINSKGVQELTILHPTDRQWIYEFEYDQDLEKFYCVKCKNQKHMVTTEFWKNKKGEEVIVLSKHHLCHIMARLFP